MAKVRDHVTEATSTAEVKMAIAVEADMEAMLVPDNKATARKIMSDVKGSDINKDSLMIVIII